MNKMSQVVSPLLINTLSSPDRAICYPTGLSPDGGVDWLFGGGAGAFCPFGRAGAFPLFGGVVVVGGLEFTFGGREFALGGLEFTLGGVEFWFWFRFWFLRFWFLRF